MVTNLELKKARMYANKKVRTRFEERQLVTFFIMLSTDQKRKACEAVSLLEDSPHLMRKAVNESVDYFKDKIEIRSCRDSRDIY